jgi:hypothetical protein
MRQRLNRFIRLTNSTLGPSCFQYYKDASRTTISRPGSHIALRLKSSFARMHFTTKPAPKVTWQPTIAVLWQSVQRRGAIGDGSDLVDKLRSDARLTVPCGP